MLNLDEINEEIAKLEECNCTTYQVCEKLAILYTVRDHYKPAMTRNTVAAPPITKTPTPPQVGM